MKVKAFFFIELELSIFFPRSLSCIFIGLDLSSTYTPLSLSGVTILEGTVLFLMLSFEVGGGGRFTVLTHPNAFLP